MKIWRLRYKRRGQVVVNLDDVLRDIREFNKDHGTKFQVFGGLRRKGLSSDIDIITKSEKDADKVVKIASFLHEKYGVKVDVFYPPEKKYIKALKREFKKALKRAVRDARNWAEWQERMLGRKVKEREKEEFIKAQLAEEFPPDGKLHIPDYRIWSQSSTRFAQGSVSAKRMKMIQTKKRRLERELMRLLREQQRQDKLPIEKWDSPKFRKIRHRTIKRINEINKQLKNLWKE